MTEETSRLIEEIYLKLVEVNNRPPTYSDFQEKGITRSKIRHHFGNMEKLHEYMVKNYAELISKIILSEADVFTKKRLVALTEDIKKYKRFVIATVVNGKEVNVPFYKTLKWYCELTNAILLLIPCADVWNRRTTNQWAFDPILENEHFIFQETLLNDNLFISSIRLSAKQINPVTSLARIGQRHGSYIFASPKQSLQYVITSADNNKIPRAIMTPGAITVPDYNKDRYMSERLSYIAENDHVTGAIIAEIQDDQYFHFRQIQADSKGSFIDLCTKYTANRTAEPVKGNLVLGDWHAGYTDQTVISAIENMCESLEINDIIVHDFFNGTSVNHHIRNQPLKLALRALKGENNLLEEIKLGGRDFNWLLARCKGKVVVTKGNHDEFLDRYLLEGNYVHDPENHYFALELARKVLELQDPVKYAYLTHGEITQPNRIVWLTRKSDYKIGGVNVGQHGDKGINGSYGSPLSLEKAYGDCIVGHTHHAGIFRGVWRVGTSTVLELDYNSSSPSSWTQTHALVYNNGQRQLINIIDGNWRLEKNEEAALSEKG